MKATVWICEDYEKCWRSKGSIDPCKHHNRHLKEPDCERGCVVTSHLNCKCREFQEHDLL